LARPPLRATSRDTVDGARASRPAMTRSDSPAARPREISSRSAVDSRSGDRIGSRAGGRFSRFTPGRSRTEISAPPEGAARTAHPPRPVPQFVPAPEPTIAPQGLLDPTDSIEAHVAFTA